MKTEYLIPVNKNNKNGFATSIEGFKHLLMTNVGIIVNANTIDYKNQSFRYSIQDYSIDATDTICYHMTIECSVLDKDFDFSKVEVKNYLSLLRIIRTTISQSLDDYETLWDDISFIYSQRAYPLIYEIENLMRKLLTKFMLVNVGAKWEERNIPSSIHKSKNQDKKIDPGNGFLYKLDFIELSDFLFAQYARKNNIADLRTKVDSKKTILPSDIEDYLPRSNWERYFEEIVKVSDNELKKKWKDLYDLRCKVAHNNHFSVDDYNKVVSIIGELKPSIEKAIATLDSISVNEDDKEIISENLAEKSNERLGEFIKNYNELENEIIEYGKIVLGQDEQKYRIVGIRQLLLDICSCGEPIEGERLAHLQRIIYFRNKLVHQTIECSEKMMESMMDQIKEQTNYFHELRLKGNNVE